MTEDEQKAQAAVQEDLAERTKHFNEELIPLLGKYRLGLGAQSLLTNDGRITARPILVDDSRPQEEQKTDSVEVAEG